MTSSAEWNARKRASIPDVWRGTGVFVAMDGALAIVNVGDKSVRIPCVGFTPPVAGIIVQLERRNGQLAVFGPAVALPAMGKIKATGTPKCTVTVGSTDYVLGYRSGYTPTIGDDVEVNWATGIIQGKVTVAPTAPGTNPTNPGGGSVPFTSAEMVVLATDSGQWSTSYSKWQGNNPRASDHVEGAWVYGSRLVDSLKGATIWSAEIFLPLQSQVGAWQIGVHTAADLSGGWVGQSSAFTPASAGGWVNLGVGYGEFLRDNIGGISVTSSGGDTNWAGTNLDAFSGAMRFSGIH